MHNFDLWQCYMKNMKSPQSYIDMGFYSMITSCLQRRIWIGSTEQKPLFPNLYIVLVGGPGIGKNLVIEQVKKFLSFHKLRTKPNQAIQILSKEAKQLLEIKQQLEDSLDQKFKNADPLLFPVCPNDITYEALLQCQANSMRRIIVDSCPMAPSGTYGHSSLSIVLNEMTTLFKRQSEKAIRYLIDAFDCGDFDYMTKHQGTDRIRRICLNLLAGITPDDIRDIVTNKIIGSGWSARNIFVYESRNRFELFNIPELDDEQKEAARILLNYLLTLSKVFGKIDYSKEALDYFKDHFENKVSFMQDIKEELIPYFARKNIHAPKLATAIHFSNLEIIEKDGKMLFDREINLQDAKQAMDILAKLEVNMHKALDFKKRNPLADISDSLMAYIEKEGPQTFNSLLTKLWNELDLGEDSLDKAIAYLTRTGKIESKTYIKDKQQIRIYGKI